MLNIFLLKQKNKSFILLELCISILIYSLIIISLYSILNHFIFFRNEFVIKEELISEANYCVEYIKTEINNASSINDLDLLNKKHAYINLKSKNTNFAINLEDKEKFHYVVYELKDRQIRRLSSRDKSNKHSGTNAIIENAEEFTLHADYERKTINLNLKLKKMDIEYQINTIITINCIINFEENK